MKLNDFSVRVPEGVETHSGYVELPHKQTYSILIRNDKDVDCVAQVHVDGKDVGRFHVKAKSNLRIEHPEDCNRKFLFLKVESDEAHDAEAQSVEIGQQGLVQVSFFPLPKDSSKSDLEEMVEKLKKMLEKHQQTIIIHHHDYPHPWHPRPWYPRPIWAGPIWYSTTWSVANTGESGEYVDGTSVYCTANSQESSHAACYHVSNQAEQSPGITGLGDVSFHEQPVGEIEDSMVCDTVISLRLVAIPGERKSVEPLKPIVRGNPIPPPVSS